MEDEVRETLDRPERSMRSALLASQTRLTRRAVSSARREKRASRLADARRGPNGPSQRGPGGLGPRTGPLAGSKKDERRARCVSTN
jgi:hypothetical protein